MTQDYEVLIAGGGPAGSACAAAILMERPDLAGRILILERARHPRTKPCGGGLTGHVPGALAALGLRLTVPGVPSPQGVVLCGDIQRTVALPRPVVVVRREAFDESLLAQVQARGAEVRQGAALRSFRVENGGVTAEIEGGGSVRARALVGADGAGSVVRKHLCGHRGGRPGPRPLRLFRAELQRENPRGDQMVYDFTPMGEGLRGYLWLFPVPGGRLNVGIMHYQGARSTPLSGAELAALCTRHLQRHGVKVGAHDLRGWPAWGYDPALPLSAPHLCVCGDAAGIDALTGEGIAVALEQGRIAGQALCAGLARGDLRLTGYGDALRRARVGRELAVDRTLARLFYDHGHGGDQAWRRWLGMVLFDEALLNLYAARVAGTLVLAEQRLRLLGVLFRHALRAGDRAAQLQAALSACR